MKLRFLTLFAQVQLAVLLIGVTEASAQTNLAATNKPAVSPPSLLDPAKKLLSSGKENEAIAALLSIRSSHPNAPEAPEASYMLAKLQAKQNKTDDALRTYNWVISHNQGSEWAAQAYEQSALIQDSLHNPTGAQELRENLLKEYPSSPTTQRVWVGIADSLYDQQKFAQAAALYQKFASKLDDAAKTRFQLANSITTAGNNNALLLSVANQALQQNKVPFAKALYSTILEQQASPAIQDEAKVRLGWCLYLQGGKANYAQAGQLWQQVSHESTASEAWQIEADWHLVQLTAGPLHDWQGAVHLCDQIAQKRTPGSFAQEQALYAKAWMLTMQKQWKEAVASWNDLQSLYPEKQGHLPVKRYLAMAEEGLNKGGTPATQ